MFRVRHYIEDGRLTKGDTTHIEPKNDEFAVFPYRISVGGREFLVEVIIRETTNDSITELPYENELVLPQEAALLSVDKMFEIIVKADEKFAEMHGPGKKAKKAKKKEGK